MTWLCIEANPKNGNSPVTGRRLNEDPFTPSLNEFVQKHADISEDESADVEAEEFCRMAGTKLKTDLRFVRMSETRVVDLTRDLINGLRGVEKPRQRTHVVSIRS